MGDALFPAAAAAFLAGAASAAAWPSAAGARRLAMLAACGGSLAAIGAAWPVLLTGVPWTIQAPALLAPLGGVSLSLDRLGAFFLALVGFTGAPASLYGLAYLKHLDRSARARVMHAAINLFLLGMCLVPAASNTVSLLLGWELMAVASYLLVVGDVTQPEAPAAG
jgi:hydrogenase-4 component B